LTETHTRLAQWLKELPLASKVAVVVAADLILLTFLVLSAYAIRVSAIELPPRQTLHLYLFAPPISIALAYGLGVYSSSARHFTFNLERRILISQLLTPAVWSVLLLAFGTEGFARSTLINYCVLSISGMILLRRAAAQFLLADNARRAPRKDAVPVLIFGAGREGLLVLDALRRHGGHKPVAFIDTDYTLVGRVVSGLKVYSTENTGQAISEFDAREVIIAKPSQGRANKRVLVDGFVNLGLTVKTVPGPDEIVDGKISVSDIRPVKIEDLLGRDAVPPDRTLMERAIKDQCVMVTGAGGSIGSELVRQAAEYNPRRLLLIENSEFALFEIHREIEARQLPFQVTPILADVQDGTKMAAIMATHEVDVIFHAAAYKHVRMVQENAMAGVLNNVFGTRATAEAARKCGVKRFILISTDKAVRPTSVMGATKRVAEMIIQALAAEKGHSTIFSMVRFGNVLGSTGSVVPLFREQIAKGGPVTVSHPDVTRYFMLIPEAAQLVIQAGAMARGGEVFVLDMGEPVRIMKLAETMIELAGLTPRSPDNPDGDIEVVITGLKDGEKLYEELQIGNDISVTSHPRIMKSREVMLPWKEIAASTTKLGKMGTNGSDPFLHEIYLALMELCGPTKKSKWSADVKIPQG
jgi:FlaA1/EpsC-like NDP-sugar epimerase